MEYVGGSNANTLSDVGKLRDLRHHHASPLDGLMMTPESVCALLHQLGQANQTIGSVTEKQLNADRIDKAADIAQRIIVELLTHLLGRPPTYAETQAATAI